MLELISHNDVIPPETWEDGKPKPVAVYLDNPALKKLFTPQVLALYPHVFFENDRREAIDAVAVPEETALDLHCPGHSGGNLFVFARIPYSKMSEMHGGLEVVVQRRIKRKTKKDRDKIDRDIMYSVPARLYPSRRNRANG